MKTKKYYCDYKRICGLDRYSHNTCTIRSMAIALDMCYWDIAEYLKPYRVKNSDGRLSGIRTAHWMEVVEGLIGKPMATYKCREMTIGRFIEENPKGRFLLGINRHAVALIDGVLYDTYAIGKRSYLQESIKIT